MFHFSEMLQPPTGAFEINAPSSGLVVRLYFDHLTIQCNSITANMAKPNNLFSTLPCFAPQTPMHRNTTSTPLQSLFQHHPKYNNKMESGNSYLSILLSLLPFLVHFSNDF
jgi:hypothetical protein